MGSCGFSLGWSKAREEKVPLFVTHGLLTSRPWGWGLARHCITRAFGAKRALGSGACGEMRGLRCISALRRGWACSLPRVSLGQESLSICCHQDPHTSIVATSARPLPGATCCQGWEDRVVKYFSERGGSTLMDPRSESGTRRAIVPPEPSQAALQLRRFPLLVSCLFFFSATTLGGFK